MLFIAVESTESIIDPNNALQKPSTSNPGDKYPASQSKNALMIRVKSPRVIIFNGSVINSNIGLINTLIKPKTIATINALTKLLTSIPGNNQAIKTIASA